MRAVALLGHAAVALASVAPALAQGQKSMVLDGKTVALPRILGGMPVPDSEFRFAAYLRMNSATGSMACTGSLIAPNVVLTAAHCALDGNGRQFEGSNVEVVFSHTAPVATKPAATYGVTQVLVNPGFRATNLSNDVALLVLNGTVPQSIAQPVKIYSGAYNTATRIIAAGYGITDADPSKSAASRLMAVALGVGSDAFCANNTFGYNHQYQICTNGAGGKDTCQGDSGGPLVTPAGPNGGLALLGVTSFAPITPDNPKGLCGVAGSTGFYARAAAYLDWIKAATNLDPAAITVGDKSPSTSKQSAGDVSTSTSSSGSESDSNEEHGSITFREPSRGPPDHDLFSEFSPLEPLTESTDMDAESTPSGASATAMSAVALLAMVAAAAVQIVVV